MRNALNWTVLIAALGYFVDMFDLTIFGVVRVASLQDLGITTPSEITGVGVQLLSLQAAGMFVGGILWGILGDKRGRLSILCGSILLYSVANILNGFVTTIESYAILRFLAGVGLAGELGAAVTLVSETMSKEHRGYGTAIIATLGLLGAVAATLIGQYWHWRTTYFIGGGLGLLLLVARFKMVDSSLFHKTESDAPRGDIRLFFQPDRFMRYFYCVVVGIPIYFTSGILFTFAPELALGLGVKGVTAGDALLYGCMGLALGDLLSGLLSQWLKSRKRAISISLIAGFCFSVLYAEASSVSASLLYVICFFLGIAGGYWAVLVTVVAEQFGTNLRATAATSVPNVVRSSIILLTVVFSYLKSTFGIVEAALILGICVFSMAGLALMRLRETFGRDLDFVEVRETVFVTAKSPVLPLAEASNS